MNQSSVYSRSVNLIQNSKLTYEETEELLRLERERHNRLIGQLKAAEARNR
jgi:ATP-dependent Clp protease ATP-binding subunit ClpA